MTDKNIYTQEVCYDIETGEPSEDGQCDSYVERAATELNYSDTLINGDLLRFKDRGEGSTEINERK